MPRRATRAAAPAYTELCEQVRNAPVVTPDETGWRVGGERYWLWVFTAPGTTVYAISPRARVRRRAHGAGTDYAGVLVRDGWAPYRCYDGLYQTCANHYADVGMIPMSALVSPSCRRLRRADQDNHGAVTDGDSSLTTRERGGSHE